MVWYPILGWGVFWISFVVAIILFAIYKKFYPIMYLISIALYIFTAGFTIDVFELQRLGILSVLVFSAIVFMALGFYLSKVLHLEKPITK
ncbi:MAG: hypothetical protein ABIB79_04710 [archaeon]